ncbi:hypothetical protein ACFOLF_28320 [Paenibacillus sepulcri]|uniref:YqfQ-like protein n=1 Tax=Paenibacillus sepulcri TaxID=359917 RepID=A0ABS7C4Q0_9BACL|nr:hypothetical protein [Paenibacillus sepulcri]
MQRSKKAKTKAFLPTQGGPSNALDQSAAPQSPSAPVFAAQAQNRAGGLDGIMSMMGKFQQMFGFFSQIGPMFKMFNSFMGPTATISNRSQKNAGTGKGKSQHRPRAAAAQYHNQVKKRSRNR